MYKKKRFNFEIENQDNQARAAILSINNIKIKTPAFMPVGTNGTVKAMLNENIQALEYNLILCNAYHLSLRPGDKLIANLGGLHTFMNWPGLILTDSGGFQAFSLSKFNKLLEHGIEFKSHIDGTSHFLSAKKAVEIQINLGSDIAMCLDVCLNQPQSYDNCEKAVKLTTKWAQESFEVANNRINMFGIIQGGSYTKLRKLSAKQITNIPFVGYAIGGVSVGEPREDIISTLKFSCPLLPNEKPRYAMGIGDPESMLEAIDSGVDMFDCVLPTRIARNGALFTNNGVISIKKSIWKTCSDPIDDDCTCMVCQNHSKAYLHHLYRSKEILSSILNTWHNLNFMQNLVANARDSILKNNYSNFKKNFLNKYFNS